MDEILRRSLLFDFYGELLTDHQKKIYEAFDGEDLSLGEIAAQEGISRQGVHDLIRRTNARLERYEDKLGLVGRFDEISRQIDEIRKIACELEGDAETEELLKLKRIIELTDRITDEI